MPEITQNTNSYYTTNAKVERRPKVVAVAPNTIPQGSLLSSKDVEIKLKNINQDIYTETTNNQKSSVKTFIKWFGIALAALLCLRWGRSIFKK